MYKVLEFSTKKLIRKGNVFLASIQYTILGNGKFEWKGWKGSSTKGLHSKDSYLCNRLNKAFRVTSFEMEWFLSLDMMLSNEKNHRLGYCY